MFGLEAVRLLGKNGEGADELPVWTHKGCSCVGAAGPGTGNGYAGRREMCVDGGVGNQQRPAEFEYALASG